MEKENLFLSFSVCVCVLSCMCIFALSICKRCIDWPKDISSNVLGDEEQEGRAGGGRDSFHLASELLREHLSINISRHGEGSGAHTHTHIPLHTRTRREDRAGIIKIATASSSQHTLAELEHVVVYTVGGNELIHLRELLVWAIDPVLCGNSQEKRRVSLLVPGLRA